MEHDSDFLQVDIFGLSLTPYKSGGGFAIILKETGGDRRLPIIIGQFEAQAIALELEGKKQQRPLTHDLLKEVIENFGYAVSSIYISELKDSTFFAKIKFDSMSVEELDARPSDAIALALKFGAPIYVASSIMDEVGFIPEFEDQIAPKDEDLEAEPENEGFAEEDEEARMLKEDESKTLTAKDRKIKQLKSELDEAVTQENYEKAAQLRDAIQKLEISTN
ncbi:MAG: bifunctional nuclease family protein [Bacteroidetes bacterium]|nr:bifunctional nuclease family protein [Bacteroidota bacterium]MBX7046302.1 bifunctional nuclease family protein [Ignavibacteria bacterium]